mmetsp:Transcript_22368/g.33046  ORF Transcript_22368/g.33046 Transcript_22368/m.33046 type:complete len:491 (+) Transcript_22368:215-1687(+)
MKNTSSLENWFQKKNDGRSETQKRTKTCECPLCGLGIGEKLINAHLDVCLERSKKRKTEEEPCNRSSTKSNAAAAAKTETTPNDKSKKKDAFTHMMELESKKQKFHLSSSSFRTFFSNQSSAADTKEEEIAWSARVQLRQIDTSNISLQRRHLLLTTSISPDHHRNATTTALVRHHSRLSIPVLKSILQKSIRRRRPLPATRVAMELADKAIGELLRRLPIILLEDSTLHPDFSFLVWLMAAHSKGFSIPRDLLTKVLKIVYEVASCPWQDELQEINSLQSSSDTKPSSSSPNNDLPVVCQAMKIRRSYGGMKCDMVMLERYERQWAHRYMGHQPCLPEDMQERPHAKSWSNIPAAIHSSTSPTKPQLQLLLENGLEKLEIQDVCLEGIDNHCSDVLQKVTAQLDLPKVKERMKLDGIIANDCSHDDDVLSIFKQHMWDYSSGVNHRQPLFARTKKKEDRDEIAKKFWLDVLDKPVKEFAMSYVNRHLVK